MLAPRLQGLDERAAQRVIAAARALALGRAGKAAAELRTALEAYPDHPEVLRLHAGVLNLRGQFPAARAAMERAVQLRPTDALYHNTLGTVLGTLGDLDGAMRALRRACELQPGLADAWYNLGVMLTRCVRNGEAAEALRKAVSLDPDNMDARALLADMLRVGGQAEESAMEYRKVLAQRPWAGVAWWGIAELRSGLLTEDDIDRMRDALRDGHATDDDRIAIGFALARALDGQGRYRESLAALARANTLARSRQRWDQASFSAWVDRVIAAFAPPPAGALSQDLGRSLVFIAGMPRSGTTLVEQILASHSDVEGSGELPDLPQVLAEESRRRGSPFPNWVRDARPADWQRLGERYLERTLHWRQRKPISTDKLPGNWTYIGAIRAMLPGAHVVVCRRDRLETCFSCYRQHLFNNEYTRTPADLAAFWRSFDQSANHWAALHPANVYQHDYERLIADPESSIRRLLEFCGLGLEDACLRFHETRRPVHSPSASQVRQPLRGDTQHARRYGNLLDPLRESLGLPRFQTHDNG